MAAQYRSGPVRRMADRAMTFLARRGVAPGGIEALTVTGRTSGVPRTVPVTPLVVEGQRYLVAPYGAVQWVRNLRAAGTGTLRSGRRVEQVRADELEAATAAPILRRYVQKTPIVRPYVAAGPDEDVAAFAAIADQHPVFRLPPAQ